ncbi:MAG: archease [Candidatus Nanoarchaeia archaeon]|nr:archease [Candidatus Haiyanarchaeum thermophilum]MCW1303096.1 archease [Candidatus Haiyanarchaeum thermophilum]MCW1303761.1 archease [Candidatus Haiyanarchaeum thermophilum]MCW1306624.1 archease [Candidatus Haiyanarchaeum thermophilum]MCW1307036.1 archease [Candidatus Haiyanarchaeum thermophilum]
MESKYIKFLEHTADVEFEALGNSLEQAFERAAIAMQSVMIDLHEVEKKVRREIVAEGEDNESLLYDFLEKILIINDSENIFFSEVKVSKIWKEGNKLKVSAVLLGEEFDPRKHRGRAVVKAVTYHGMRVGKKDGKFYVHVVLDI